MSHNDYNSESVDWNWDCGPNINEVGVRLSVGAALSILATWIVVLYYFRCEIKHLWDHLQCYEQHKMIQDHYKYGNALIIGLILD